MNSGHNRFDSLAFRYAGLADLLEKQIRSGTFRAGDRLPSIRDLRAQTGLSVSTVYHTFIELEKRGLIQPRERSGYFVRPLLEGLLPAPQPPVWRLAPRKVSVNDLAFTLVEAMGDPGILQLGGALIAPELLPLKEIGSILKGATLAQLEAGLAGYEHYLGQAELRRQIARRLAPLCGPVRPEQLVITNGCIEAVALGLKAATQPGQTVLVESPTFPWFLQLIEDLNLHALEVPADPQSGLDLEVLERSVRGHDVKACILVANFNNPLGFVLDNGKKQAMVERLNALNVPIIEDDVYGELHFSPSRPLPLKAFDRKGLVLYCSSFSKSLSPGLRVGWIMAGGYFDRVRRLKTNQAISAPGLTQWAAARYLRGGSFDRHLRGLRTHLKNQVGNTALAIARYFPKGTKISSPQGGLTLWVELDPRVDSLELFRRALEKRIAVMPGAICASGKAYRHCIRVSCGLPYSERIDRGLETLAALARSLAS